MRLKGHMAQAQVLWDGKFFKIKKNLGTGQNLFEQNYENSSQMFAYSHLSRNKGLVSFCRFWSSYKNIIIKLIYLYDLLQIF